MIHMSSLHSYVRGRFSAGSIPTLCRLYDRGFRNQEMLLAVQFP